jgi:hypothetical protein
MDTTTMIEEIINCGITSESTILNFGVGYKNGELLKTLCDFWGLDYSDLREVTGVDADGDKVNTLSERFQNVNFVNSSMQEYLDNVTEEVHDWVVLTGVFDNNDYGDSQYDFILKTIERTLESSNSGVVFTLNLNPTETFSYNSVFIFASLITTYTNVFVKKFEDDNYVFCILK